MNSVVSDTISGALILSVFDFVMSFVVLAFFGLIIGNLKRLG